MYYMNINIFNKNEKPYFHIATNEKIFNQLYEATCENFKDHSKKFVAIIEGKKCRNEKKLFQELANKLSFPNYFGNNWDALNECFNDLEWLDCEQYVLFINDLDAMFKNKQENLKIFLDILVGTTIEWNEGREYDHFTAAPLPFHIVFYSESKASHDLLSNQIHQDSIMFLQDF